MANLGLSDDLQESINFLRARGMRDRLMVLEYAAIRLAKMIGVVADQRDHLNGSQRRDIQLRNIETYIASATEFTEFFLSDLGNPK